MKPYLCIYHGSCLDGFSAAWVVRKALGEENVDFFHGVYQQTPPDCKGRDVIFVDFCYRREIMQQIVIDSKSVLVLDHHKSAQDEMSNVLFRASTDKVFFDMEHSGAVLAWIHFFTPGTTPILLNLIEDRDLWKFKWPLTREVNAAMFSYEYTFENWDKLMKMQQDTLATEGAAIDRKHHKDIDELLKVVCRPMVIGGIRVLVANLPYTMGTDAAVKLIEQGQPFGAYCYDVPDGRVFGLRSTDAGPDVSEIAKQYGGGGHRNAAGFRVKIGWVEEV